MNEKIRTVIVDDSAIARGIIEKSLKNDGGFEIVAMLSNGRKAVDFCSEESVDLVISDCDMPEMNGLEEAKIISSSLGIPICLYSDSSADELNAISSGAFLFEKKPSFSNYSAKALDGFIQKIKSALKNVSPNSSQSLRVRESVSSVKASLQNEFKVLCIGASTGGPTAVEEVLSGLGKNFPLPILYVQHIDSGSDEKMVEWFNTCCPNTPMHLARDGETAKAGHVYMAPADKHLVIDFVNSRGLPVLKLSDEPPERFLRPAVNKLFRSAAGFYRESCLAVLLTGMGRDGADGCKKIVENGGYTIAEDKSTCAVFGMPAAAIELNAAKRVCRRNLIAQEILALL